MTIYKPVGMQLNFSQVRAVRTTKGVFNFVLQDGSSDAVVVHLLNSELATLMGDSESGRTPAVVVELIEQAVGRSIEASEIHHWGCSPAPAEPALASAKRDRRAAVHRACSLLALAKRALPPEVREEALQEWVDEIESAAEEGQPVRRRAVSIVLRALPVLAVRSRLPARVRGGGS
jgi:hypothetical protein